MSLEQIQSTLLALSPEDRRAFVGWFYQNEGALIGDEELELSEEQRQEILRRSEELRANPQLAQPVDEDFFERMKEKVADALSDKAPAR